MNPATQTASLLLNSFQGPSLGLRRSVVQGAARAAVRTARASGCAARWMLKRVQHDYGLRGAQ